MPSETYVVAKRQGVAMYRSCSVSKQVRAGFLAVLVAVGCPPGGGEDHAPATIAIITGDGQSAVAGTELPTPITVRVADSRDRPVSGATVTWSVAEGGGSVYPSASTTDGWGVAAARWTLGPAPGTNRSNASVSDRLTATFEAEAMPDETSGRVATVTVGLAVAGVYEGDTVQLTATARDAAGAIVPGKAANWSSSNPDAFAVSADGVLRTWGVGPVTVTATIDGVSGSRTLPVEPIQVIVTLGAKQLVFQSWTDSCEPLDLPDHPVRLVRAEDGSLVMFTGNAPRYYASRGGEFGTIRRDCSAPVLVSRDLRSPESYENWEWPWVFYRIGGTWHALISNEYHDTSASTCSPGDPSPSNPCWYNSLTHAVSTDGARTFTKPLAPAHTVAPPPRAWTPPAAGSTPGMFGKYLEGYTAPTNIVRHADGYYYALLTLNPDKNTSEAHACVMRTSTLEDPASWRAWDGIAFDARLASPYVIGTNATACAPPPRPVGLASLTYSTYLDRYVALDNMVMFIGDRHVCGFYLQLSSDLVHWSDPTLVVEASIGGCSADPARPGVLEPVEVIFPSFIDHSDATVNFERIGQTAYLYYVRFNSGVFDRDVLRVPVTFTRQN